MAQTTLHEILDQLRTLNPKSCVTSNERFARISGRKRNLRIVKLSIKRFLASGLVKQIKPPHQDVTQQRRLIEVQGRPVSETIVAERR